MKRVAFHSKQIYHLNDVPPSSMMNEDERNRTWYSFRELETMKQHAKDQVKLLRSIEQSSYGERSNQLHQHNQVSGTHQSNKELHHEMETDDGQVPTPTKPLHHIVSNENLCNDLPCRRGLEARISIERQLRKTVYSRTIVRAFQRGRLHVQDAKSRNDPRLDAYKTAASEALRNLCWSQSKKSIQTAIVAGRSDFECVYGDATKVHSEHYSNHHGKKNETWIHCERRTRPLDQKRKAGCSSSFDCSNLTKRAKLLSMESKSEGRQVLYVHGAH